MKCIAKIFLLGMLIISMPAIANAMAGMYSAKYVDGPNVILLANNVHDTKSNMPITYNLRVYDMDGKPVNFGNVRVNLKQDQKSLQELNARRTVDGDASVILTYPKQGTYMIAVAFLDNDKIIAKGEFPIVASKNPDQGWLAEAISLPTGLGFMAGVIATVLVMGQGRLIKQTKK